MQNIFRSLLPPKKRRSWRLVYSSLASLTVIRITDPYIKKPPKQNIYVELLQAYFHDDKQISISQKFDRDQWNIGDPYLFASHFEQTYGLKTAVTLDYHDIRPPRDDHPELVIHLLGRLDPLWLNEIYGTGGVSLPNILYGLSTPDIQWPAQIIEWHKSFIPWFNLEVPDIKLEELASRVGNVSFSIDGELFLTANDSNLAKIENHLEAMANQHDRVIVKEKGKLS